jgi:hypothetical protein
MSRKQHPQRSTGPASASPEAGDVATPSGAAESTVDGGPDPEPASMRDAMRAALDAKAARRGAAPGSGPRGAADGRSARDGGAKGFRALPRRSAG